MANFKQSHKTFLNAGGPHRGWMNADFAPAQDLVKKAEGGYSDDKRDPGNYTGGKIGVGALIGTKYGIAAPTLKNYLKREPSVNDMKNLPYSTAEKIYRSEYWNAVKGDAIDNQKLANIIYDASVNHGPGKARSLVNESLKTEKYDIAKINSANPEKLFNEIGKKREVFYKKLGGYALNSWLDRLEKLGYTGIDIAKKLKAEMAIAASIALFITGTIIFIKS